MRTGKWYAKDIDELEKMISLRIPKARVPYVYELTFRNGWNGGSFSHKVHEGLTISIVHPYSGQVLDYGTLTKGNIIEGHDFDMGHEYAWEFQDWFVVIEGDRYDRRTSLRALLERGEVMITFIKE
ncbi:hypothetical protein KAMAJI_00520 [Serratia phage vB_SmaM-Kamaji]|nr:hypothetical protein KAMAJI_00520 [Serratia phage vB_SmaM-Kamaji]